MTFDIRPIERQDLRHVIPMWTSLMDNGQAHDPRWRRTPDSTAKIRAWAEDLWMPRTPFPYSWVAVADHPVGWLEGHPAPVSPVLDQPRTALIANLWVEPDHRQQGLGRRLVEAFVLAASQAGYPEIEVGTLTRDRRAIAFWEALGFGPWRVILRRSPTAAPGPTGPIG